MLVWDATLSDTLAPSHTNLAAREPGAGAEEAELRKKGQYVHLEAGHYFVSVAVKIIRVFGPEAHSFFGDLGQHLIQETRELREHHCLL